MASKAPTRGGAGGRQRVSSNKTKRGVSALRALRHKIRARLGRQSDDVWGVVLVVAAVLIVLAFFRQAGPLGSSLIGFFRFLFGQWSYLVPALLAGIGIALIVGKPRSDYGRVTTGIVLVFVGTLSLFHLLTGAVSIAESVELVSQRGGALGSLFAFPMRRLIGFWGAFVVLSTIIAMGVLIVTRTSVRDVGRALRDGFRVSAGRIKSVRRTDHTYRGTSRPAVAEGRKRPKQKPPAKPPEPELPEPIAEPPTPEPVRTGDYELPPLDLLKLGAAAPGHGRRSLEETAQDLEDALREHDVDARLTRVVPGPTVTRFEIELAPGVKVSRVTSLASDIAYALATPDVRILAPIPGRSAIGVEVPNRHRRLVTLGDVLSSAEGASHHQPLVVALGMDISGTARMLDLSDLPHVLIAGATGAGKSSCINSMVCSLLMRTTPDDVRLIMVDPKRVELGQYNGVPHLLTRVIVNPKKAADALGWAVQEMDRRYELLAEAGARDIISYGQRYDAGELDLDRFDRFPFIVIMVDELNDLMMVAGRDVEEAVVRIAQMARAVGIHLVIATQRPSVDVITGVIKANIPSRLAFSVASQADSRVILDQGGAEKLVGMGDMLMVTATSSKPERIQGAWVDESETKAIVEWVKSQQDARYQDEVIEQTVAQTRRSRSEDEGEDPELVRQAMELVVRSQLGSTSMLQRRLRVGFARAGRLMDILELKGVVGPSEGSKARAVLVTPEELAESTEEPIQV
ncbi:MAG: DNA translocase FtsK [Acidimicrobiia bacterium]